MGTDRVRAVLEIHQLETGYGLSQVLFGIDLAVGEGEVAALLGRNGTGKTTTVRAVLGLCRAWRGTIAFRGERIDALETDAIARRGIALVPEGRQIFPNLTVREHLVAFADNRCGTGDPWTPERVFALFPQLAVRADAPGVQLSGGEQQMLAIGRALVTNPRLLILDEATEGLAPHVAREIWRIIREIRSHGIATVIVDKNYAAIGAIADRNVILVKGRVVFEGDTRALLADRDFLHRHLGV